jgi:hypothetical protein
VSIHVTIPILDESIRVLHSSTNWAIAWRNIDPGRFITGPNIHTLTVRPRAAQLLLNLEKV